MFQRIALCALVCVTFTLPVKGAAVIVDDNFDSYTDQADFEAAWNPDFGDGNFDLTGLSTAGRLVPDPGNGDITPPNDDPPGIQGQAVALKSLINESKESFALVPTASESIKFGGDLYTDGGQGKKLTVALRNDTVERELGVFGMNYVELGYWNAFTFDPVDPANAPPNAPTYDIPAGDLGYRIVLFGAASDPLVRNPDWQYFPLDISLDVDDTDENTTEPTPDERVSIVDIGEGWHSFEATISPTQVTLTLDLFRDGVINLTRDVNGDIEVGVGDTGFDSVVTWDIVPSNLNTEDEFEFDPFTSLRFGVPSGTGGGNEAVVDNVKLETIDVAAGVDGDFDGDGDVDGNDFLVWQRGGSPNGINSGDLALWQSNYGNPALSANIAAVPEPASAALLLFAMASLVGRGAPKRQ